jgi:hypothetical protein
MRNAPTLHRLRTLLVFASALLAVQRSEHAHAQGLPPLVKANQFYQAGKYDSAIVTARGIITNDSSNLRAWSLLASSLQASGQLDQALAVNRRLTDRPAARPAALYRIGLVYGGKGALDSAFTYLQQAKQTGKVNLADIDIDPNAEPLRKDPRYIELKPSAAEFAKPFAEPFRIIGEWHGSQVNEQFGWIARDIGDVDGDKVHDFVTSGPGYATDGHGAGAVYVYSSKSRQLLWKKAGRRGDGLGQGIEAAGDVNRDGIPDVIASSPGIGQAYLYSGRDGTLLRTLGGEDPNDAFGAHVDGVGDVDHDGYADVIVGAPGHDRSTGRAYVFSGKDGTTMLTLDGARSGDRFGSAVSGWSDAKHTLIVVGAPGAGPQHTGRVSVYETLSTAPKFTFDSDSTGAALGGMFVAVPGDFDGDGMRDVYASDWNNNANGRSSGRIYVLSSATGKPVLTLTGETAGDGFGTSASIAGDVDHDGIGDLVIGAWQHASKAVSGGKIYLYSGKAGRLLRTWTGQVPGQTLGFDAVGIGDVDGDGATDFLVTSAYSAIDGSHSGRVFIIAGDTKY